MKWSIPPLLERYAEFFDASPIGAVLLALLVIVVLLLLLKMAVRFFVIVVVLFALVLLASYFINGEDKTNEAIRRGADQSSEIINQHLEKTEPKKLAD
ncbi:MAG: hypothetical protein QGF46_07835 [Planctomycetota bacterium]|jgi:membrane protein implicated in regulation of membrane protease activity|nr:hypothetical protein [Planctomycetota bacterium]